MIDLYGASIDGIEFQAETIRDEFEKSIAKHEFPYRDGAQLEDMGQKARKIVFTAYFLNDKYADHITLIGQLAEKTESELIHPQYGLVKGYVESMSVRHDDRQLTAEVDITFVEEMRGEFADTIYEDVGVVLEGLFAASQAEQQEELAEDMREDLGAEAEDILAKELDPEQGILEQLTGLSKTAREYVKQIDTYVRTLEATLSDIANPAKSLLATINYMTNLPGRVIGAVARTAERYALLYDTVNAAPEQFLRSLESGLLELNAVTASGSASTWSRGVAPPLAKHTSIATAQRLSLEEGYRFKEDEARRDQVRRAEQQSNFDALGRYRAPEQIEPLMTIGEIERCLAVVRTNTQTAVDEARGMQSLKDMAESLLSHINRIKLERDRIMVVEVSPAMPLHLLCLRYGLPYNYAERIHSINTLPHPSFANGEVRIYARP